MSSGSNSPSAEIYINQAHAGFTLQREKEHNSSSGLAAKFDTSSFLLSIRWEPTALVSLLRTFLSPTILNECGGAEVKTEKSPDSHEVRVMGKY